MRPSELITLPVMTPLPECEHVKSWEFKLPSENLKRSRHRSLVVRASRELEPLLEMKQESQKQVATALVPFDQHQ